MLGVDDPLPGSPRRVLVAGTSGSGKTTLARRVGEVLQVPHVAARVLTARRITDRYLTGTRLRLRHSQRLDTGESEFKFTQKIPNDVPGPIQGWITNTYLNPVSTTCSPPSQPSRSPRPASAFPRWASTSSRDNSPD
jgi:energy-coupling factor transporter ATP-binding protein EcfA2